MSRPHISSVDRMKGAAMMLLAAAGAGTPDEVEQMTDEGVRYAKRMSEAGFQPQTRMEHLFLLLLMVNEFTHCEPFQNGEGKPEEALTDIVKVIRLVNNAADTVEELHADKDDRVETLAVSELEKLWES